MESRKQWNQKSIAHREPPSSSSKRPRVTEELVQAKHFNTLISMGGEVLEIVPTASLEKREQQTSQRLEPGHAPNMNADRQRVPRMGQLWRNRNICTGNV
jgi:hypothetical protein